MRFVRVSPLVFLAAIAWSLGEVVGYCFDLLFAAGAGSVLLIGADVMTRIVDPGDRGTAILFADAAGALVLSPGGGSGLLGCWPHDCLL